MKVIRQGRTHDVIDRLAGRLAVILDRLPERRRDLARERDEG
jgi:hypothetical protein